MKLTMILALGLAGCVAAWAGGTSEPPAQAQVPAAADVAEDVSALMVGGRTALGEGRWLEAATLFEKIRVLQPSNNEATFGLSAAYLELKRFPDALPLLETLVKAVPDSPMVKNNLAWVLLHVKDASGTNTVRAVKLSRAALLDAPSDFSVWHTLAEAYYASGRYDKALAAAENGLRLSLLAGVTNSPCRELVARCRKAAGNAGSDETDREHP